MEKEIRNIHVLIRKQNAFYAICNTLSNTVFQNDCFHAFEKFAKASWMPAVSFWPTWPVYGKIHWNAFAVENKCFTISAASIAFFSLVLIRRTITAGWLEAHGVKIQSVASNSKPCVTENTEWIQFSAGCFNFFQLCVQNIVLFVQVDGEGSEKKSLNRTHFPLVRFYHRLLIKSLEPYVYFR